MHGCEVNGHGYIVLTLTFFFKWKSENCGTFCCKCSCTYSCNCFDVLYVFIRFAHSETDSFPFYFAKWLTNLAIDSYLHSDLVFDWIVLNLFGSESFSSSSCMFGVAVLKLNRCSSLRSLATFKFCFLLELPCLFLFSCKYFPVNFGIYLWKHFLHGFI